MPTYQYRCPECGHEFEEFQSMTEDPIELCPACGGKTRRIISGGAGLLFKGSGFYITDYRSDSYKSASKKETGASESKSSETKKTEPKPQDKKSSPKD